MKGERETKEGASNRIKNERDEMNWYQSILEIEMGMRLICQRI